MILEDFMRRQEIELILLQEVTQDTISAIGNYTAHINIGTDGRGKAILAKEGFTLTNIQKISSGRGISATLQGIRIVNIFAPSGSEKKREREVFYNGEVATLLLIANTGIILAGDLNCVISNAGSTGESQQSARKTDKRTRFEGCLGRNVSEPNIHALDIQRRIAH
jgi:exonuclease III